MTWNSWAINEQRRPGALPWARVRAIPHDAWPLVPIECGQASEQSSDKPKIFFGGKGLQSLIKE
jgi:hypothetical protein